MSVADYCMGCCCDLQVMVHTASTVGWYSLPSHGCPQMRRCALADAAPLRLLGMPPKRFIVAGTRGKYVPH
jgi:hypothetical protein